MCCGRSTLVFIYSILFWFFWAFWLWHCLVFIEICIHFTDSSNVIPVIVQTAIRDVRRVRSFHSCQKRWQQSMSEHICANWAHSVHTPRVGTMSSGTTNKVRADTLVLFLLLLPLPPNEHPPWRAVGDVVVALTISIFTHAGATDAMPLSRASAYSLLLSFSSLLLYPCLSSRTSIYYKSMDTLHRRSQRRALAPNYASASGGSV
jgi:hypothetical protein